MDNNSVVGGALLPNAGTAWTCDAVADFNGDNNLDVWWRDYTTGQNYIWYMVGSSVTGGAPLPAVSDTDWHIGQ